jgi:hypothetical protein
MKRITRTYLCATALVTGAIMFAGSPRVGAADNGIDRSMQTVAAPVEKTVVETQPQPRVQIAILLDTSGSMSGLIEQAKAQLWQIVNQFASAKQHGKRPLLTVALYEYGKSTIPASEQYLRMILPLTDDLDKVSQELFALRTNGGDEYCGTVIQAATRGLDWSASNQDYKAIFIAGNEPFTQGQVDYNEACRAAITKGIIVNTIFCGPHETGIATKWKDGAALSDGSYASIDQNRSVVAIAAPQDKELASLGKALNLTYVPFGEHGKFGLTNQMEQDGNSMGYAISNMAQRAATKASVNYRNGKWDLVDALKDGKIELEKIEKKDLPKAMQDMTVEQRAAYVKEQATKRVALQTKIRSLTAARNTYVAQERRKLASTGRQSLEDVMIKSINEQAAAKHFEFAESAE